MATGALMNTASHDNAARHRIIVFVEQESGALAQVTEALREAGVAIEAIDRRLADEFGAISLRTSDDDAALLALLATDLRAVTTEAVVFHLDDKPGALADVARLFAGHRLRVRTIHIVHRRAGHAIVAVTTDDDARARSLIDSESLL
jgi:hypothetical protein